MLCIALMSRSARGERNAWLGACFAGLGAFVLSSPDQLQAHFCDSPTTALFIFVVVPFCAIHGLVEFFVPASWIPGPRVESAASRANDEPEEGETAS